MMKRVITVVVILVGLPICGRACLWDRDTPAEEALGADGGAESPAGCDAGHERDWCTEPGLQRPTERATRPVEGAGRSLRQGVWVFNGKRAIFPSGVFTSRENAEAWINQYGLEGTLTLYPIDQSVYDYAIENGWFDPKSPRHLLPEFMQRFTSASQEHCHYERDESP